MKNFRELRMVFMGTPEFAVASLEALENAGCNIVGVITAPDKPAGRGMKMTESAVKRYALLHGFRVLQPPKLKDPQFLEELKSLRADIQVVVAFRMLPEVVWKMPPMGTINLHGSLLPDYRGAAPINWAVIQGEKETGVTTFQLKHEIDTGDMLMQERIPIGEDETAGELHDRMKETGAAMLVKTIKGLADGTLKPISQADVSALPLKHAPRIFTENCLINWHDSTAHIHNLIRGLSPYPGAFTHLHGKILKIFKSEKETISPLSPPGLTETDGRTYLKFAASDGYIHVKDLQLEGKKRMTTADFLRGYRMESEDKSGNRRNMK